MTNITLAPGIKHTVPQDLRQAIVAASIVESWNSLTPIARNEWICWVTLNKKAETRSDHIVRLCAEIKEGKRRPCCWPGCPHRNANAKKWFKNQEEE